MKTAVIDVGGGLRGIYAAGVFDTCLDDQIHFDLAIGVSAGSGNILSYIAGQRGRNYKYYIEYSRRPEYMGLDQLIKEGSLINLDRNGVRDAAIYEIFIADRIRIAGQRQS